MRLLFLSRWFPYPADNGAKLRVLNLLRQLAAWHTVHLISFTSEPVSSEGWAALRALCQQVDTVQYRPFQPWTRRALAGLFDARPRSVLATHSPDLTALVQRAAREYSFDIVLASEIDMAPYALEVDASARVLEELEITTVHEQFQLARGLARRLRAGLTWWKLKRYVRGLLTTFDLCTVVSERERETVARLAPAGAVVEVVPNGVDLTGYQIGLAKPVPDTLIYSGALTYAANLDAVVYFLSEIFPRIQAARPGIQLTVTGRLEGVALERLPQLPGVSYSGYVPDIRPVIAGHWASVVPLRIGGGTRLKILEALALGTPVIATRKGAEGLELIPGRDVLIADTPAEFSEATVSLLADPVLRDRLARHGRAIVAERYDWAMIGRRFANRLAELPAAASRATLLRRLAG